MTKRNEKKIRGVFERPKDSGIWWIRYTDQYGKLHREKVGAKSLAVSAYRKRKTELKEGKFFPDKITPKKDVLFKDMAKSYLNDYSKINKRSWKTDQGQLAKLNIHLGDKPLSQITQQDVERFRASLLQNNLTHASANRYMALLKCLFNKGISWGKCTNNPVKGIKPFTETHRTRFLSPEEEYKLRENFPPLFWPWVEIAFHTGMRRSEQFNLQWDNINFQTSTITIPQSKSGETRHIPMNDRVLEILRDLPSRLKSQWLFPSANNNTPKDSQNFINNIFLPALKKAGIDDLHWHDLRHTFASRLVMSGVDIRTVQVLLGHKTIAMTLKYSHLSPGHQRDAVQRLISNRTGTTSGTNKNEGSANIG